MLQLGGEVIGIDEVGRGCLAGPVFAAACCVPLDFSIPGLTDSKLLSAEKRELLLPKILQIAKVGVGFASVQEIDQINILQATWLAMKRALTDLEKEIGEKKYLILVDGKFKIPQLEGYQQQAIIKGDQKEQSIAAASIVAKVQRDNLMKELDKIYPEYGLAKHKGYAASEHLKAICRIGPSPQHRSTFARVKEYWSESTEQLRARDLVRVDRLIQSYTKVSGAVVSASI